MTTLTPSAATGPIGLVPDTGHRWLAAGLTQAAALAGIPGTADALPIPDPSAARTRQEPALWPYSS